MSELERRIQERVESISRAEEVAAKEARKKDEERSRLACEVRDTAVELAKKLSESGKKPHQVLTRRGVEGKQFRTGLFGRKVVEVEPIPPVLEDYWVLTGLANHYHEVNRQYGDSLDYFTDLYGVLMDAGGRLFDYAVRRLEGTVSGPVVDRVASHSMQISVLGESADSSLVTADTLGNLSNSRMMNSLVGLAVAELHQG